jgi:hypothetical protein
MSSGPSFFPKEGRVEQKENLDNYQGCSKQPL